MKKTLSAITIGALLLPVAAFASSITLAPASVATVAGKTFSVTVGVNPTSGKAYTVRANLSFDPAMLELTGFSFAPKWMALPQAGYDTEDNTNGVMAKTGGYPGGITAQTTLGTATFRAKRTGTATIIATADSLILDANNQNVLAGASVQTAVAISAPAPVQTTPTTSTTPTTPTVEPTEEGGVLGEETPTVQEPTTASQPIASQSMLAAVGSIVTLGTDSVIVGLLVVVSILALAGYAIYAVIQTRRKNLGKPR